MVPNRLTQPLARKLRLQRAPTLANVSFGVARRVPRVGLTVSVLAQHTSDLWAVVKIAWNRGCRL